MHVLDALGDWQDREGPLYRRLAEALTDAIANGDLPAGRNLPAERALAARLAIARSTVVNAYDTLRAAGLVESRQGAGTWVAGASRRGQREVESPEALRSAISFADEDVIDLATASLPADRAVLDALRACADDPDLEVFASPGYFRYGLPRLRSRIAVHLSAEGLPTEPDQVLITTGEQQAFSLLAEHYLSSGDVAVLTDPSSPGALDVLRGLPVTIRAGGSLSRPNGVVELTEVVDRGPSRMLICAPTVDYESRCPPDTALATLSRRLRTYEGVVVVDEAQRELAFTPPRLWWVPDGTAESVIVGSFSKLFWGGLRVGWVRAAASTIARLGRTKSRADLGTPVISQMVVDSLMGRHEEVRARRVEQLQSQLVTAETLLAELLPEFTFSRPQGGLTVWIRLPTAVAEPLRHAALRRGVAVAAGTVPTRGGAGDDHLRVAFARPPEEIEDGLRRLRGAWEWLKRE